MKKYASIAIRKGKTDPLDAIKIANYGIDYWFRLADFKFDNIICMSEDEFILNYNSWAKEKGYQ